MEMMADNSQCVLWGEGSPPQGKQKGYGEEKNQGINYTAKGTGL